MIVNLYCSFQQYKPYNFQRYYLHCSQHLKAQTRLYDITLGNSIAFDGGIDFPRHQSIDMSNIQISGFIMTAISFCSLSVQIFKCTHDRIRRFRDYRKGLKQLETEVGDIQARALRSIRLALQTVGNNEDYWTNHPQEPLSTFLRSSDLVQPQGSSHTSAYLKSIANEVERFLCWKAELHYVLGRLERVRIRFPHHRAPSHLLGAVQFVVMQ